MIKGLLALFTESTQSFQGQEAGEKVILIVRQHIFTILYPLLLVFLAAFIPVLVKLAFTDALTLYRLTDVFIFLSSLWYALLWLLASYLLMLYALNTVVITDRRLIESQQLGFFNRKVSELHVYRIQDVSVHTQGFIETFLSYGTITVQTAAAEREFIFAGIGRPEEVKDVIMDLVSHHRPPEEAA
jgi:hypothetical protein